MSGLITSASVVIPWLATCFSESGSQVPQMELSKMGLFGEISLTGLGAVWYHIWSSAFFLPVLRHRIVIRSDKVALISFKHQVCVAL